MVVDVTARVAIAGLGVMFVAIVATTPAARADSLATAIAKGDVAGLRARPGEPDARCALGVVYAHKKDLSRAMLYLAGCQERANLDAAIAGDVVKTAREVERSVSHSQLSKLEIVTRPSGMVAEIDALPGERFITDITLWLEAGSYDVRAAADVASLDGKRGILTNHVEIKPHSQGLVILDSAPAKKPSEPKTVDIDIAEPSDRIEGPPPAVKHPPMVKGKLSGETIVGYDGVERAVGDTSAYIDDPDAPTKRANAPATQRVVVRGGVAMSRRIGENAAGVDFAIEHHLIAPWQAPRETHPVELISRLDWSERGYHVLGAAAAVGKIVAAPSFGTFGLGLGLHAQLRFDDELDHMPMRRFGIDAAASAELALKDSPIDLGVRVEQGLAHIVAGARERAIIFEIGLEFRDFGN